MISIVAIAARHRFDNVAVKIAAHIPRVKNRADKRRLGLTILNIAKRLHQASTEEVE